LRDVSLAELWHHVRQAEPARFLLAVVIATLLFPIRTIRWVYLLRYEGAPLPFRPLWHATAIGFMANNVLPARAGEFARAYAARQLTGVRFTTALASVAVERILDGLVLVLLLIIAMVFAGFDATTTIGGMPMTRIATIAAVVFGILFLLAVGVVHKPTLALTLADRLLGMVFPARWTAKIRDLLEGAVGGLDALRTPSRLIPVALWSVILWLTGAASFWVGAAAFDLNLPFSGAMLLQTLIGFGVAIPSSPGFFGPFEAVTRATLSLYGIAAGPAVAFAVAFHIGGFIPITVLGLWSLWRADLQLGTLWRREA
jgi:glycosyltransferase 2 family protein